MKKRRILKRRRDGKKQHYWVGRNPKRKRKMAWTTDIEYPLFANPSKKYKAERLSIPTGPIIDELKKPGETREDWIKKMKRSPSDNWFVEHENKESYKKGKYDLEGLKESIKSKKGKVPAVTIDKVDGRLKLWEGRHRVAAAHELGELVPAVILEKKKPKNIYIS